MEISWLSLYRQHGRVRQAVMLLPWQCCHRKGVNFFSCGDKSCVALHTCLRVELCEHPHLECESCSKSHLTSIDRTDCFGQLLYFRKGAGS